MFCKIETDGGEIFIKNVNFFCKNPRIYLRNVYLNERETQRKITMGNNKFLFTIIVLFMMFIATPSISQDYEYAEEAVDGGYEYAEEAVDGGYEYAEEAVDGEYEYAEEAVDGEYEYEEETDDVVENGEEEIVDLVTDTEEPKAVINVPLYQNYRIPMVVDPKNPKLPANHNLARLRGTIWRGDEVVIRTNARGVLGEYRPFIFFNAKEDAIAYRYVPVGQQKLPEFPRTDNYIVLNPLLKTNNYVPTMAAQADPLGNIALDNRIKFVANPLLLNHQSYEAALEKMRLQAEENRKSKDSTTVTTNIGVIAEPAEEEVVQAPTIVNCPAQFYVTTNRTITIITNVTQNVIQNETIQVPTIPFVIQEGTTQVQDIPSMQTMFQGVPEFPEINTPEIQEPQEADFFSTDQYPSYGMDPEYLYDAYADNQFGSLNFSPLKMVAQNINQTDLADDQYVINVGEQNSGIFVHQTDDINVPYKVIFLALDEAMNLYEYSVDNAFDVRDSNSDTSQKARELYLQILEEKINMKKFQRVRVKSSYLD